MLLIEPRRSSSNSQRTAFLRNLRNKRLFYVLGESEACLATKIDEGDTTHAADRTQEKQS